MKLDAKSAAALKLGDKSDVIRFDDVMPGFGSPATARCRWQALRSWVVSISTSGATRRVLLGLMPRCSSAEAGVHGGEGGCLPRSP